MEFLNGGVLSRLGNENRNVSIQEADVSERASVGRRATLAMVADAAGVSKPTVSKVLNGRPDVSPATRARVQEALRAQAYVSPVKAPQAHTAARVIDLVFDDFESPYTLAVMRGVLAAAGELDIEVVVGRFPTAGARDVTGPRDAWAGRLAAAGREGIIVVTSELTSDQIAAFERAQVPLVVIDPVNLPSVEVASVGSANWSGGQTATEHLIKLGHRRIAYLGGLQASSCNQARRHGYLAAMNDAAIQVDPDLICHGDFGFETGYRNGLQVLDLHEPPTAVFAASDPIGLGVLEAARERGLSVPRDLSVVGFDDTYLAEHATPPLTTVRQPLQDMGRVALRTLLRLGAGDPPDSHHVELATELVVRQSTTPPHDSRPR
jgi:LacI family transcriptional regulator